MQTILSQIHARTNNPFAFNDMQMEERIINFNEDPLVLACTLKAYQEEGKGYLSLDDHLLPGLITDQDRDLAEKIREHFTKKFFWRALSDTRSLSDYRRRLINLLENRIKSCKDQDCGIYYKLPYFYEEDVIYEEFKKTLKTKIIDSLGSSRHNKMSKRLTFLKTTLCSQRKRKIIRYWFKDNNDFLYSIELTNDNPLLPIFNDYLKEQSSVLFETRITEDRIDDLYFYKMFQYKFIKE